LDISSDKVVCLYCNEEVVNVSSYIIESMRSIGDLLRYEQTEAFEFPCSKCNKRVRVDCSGDAPAGRGCDDDCDISITDIMARTIMEYDEKAG
jgi:hypothetical protein